VVVQSRCGGSVEMWLLRDNEVDGEMVAQCKGMYILYSGSVGMWLLPQERDFKGYVLAKKCLRISL
jgi:hypothetical protein